MITNRKKINAAAELALRRAQAAGKVAAAKMVAATDAVLVEAGRAAQRRQRRRAVRAGVKMAAKAMLIAGTAAATVAAVRAVRARKTTA